jgi:hypothetical protein
MSKNLNISVLVAARDEYIEQLKSIISPLIIQGVNSIYQDALKVSQGKNIIMTFQQFLKDILTWNQTILQEEAKRIKKKCPYIMDIVTAIFVSNVKILASIRLKGNNDNIKVKIPTCEIFTHSIYIEAAQQIFYDPLLFYHKNGNFNQIQKNKKYVREIIFSAVDESIRKMMPFDHILEEYLKNALDDNAEYTDSDSESESDEEPENTLVNDKIINEDEEETPETEEETTKNLHIDGLNSYIKENNVKPPEPFLPPYQPQPIQQSTFPQQSNDNASDYSMSGSDSDSDSDSSGSSFSSKSSSSSSSSSSGSDRSRKRSEQRPEVHSEGRPEGHPEHRSKHGKHGKRGKHKYSFF